MYIRNEHGERLFIPEEHRAKIKDLISKGRHSEVDDLVNSAYATGGVIGVDPTYQGGILPEVNITAKDPRSYATKLGSAIAKNHQNDNFLEVAASPLTYPLEALQRMVTSVFTGKPELPSEAIARTKVGQKLQTYALTNPQNLAVQAVANPTVQNTILDPTNLIGTGLASKAFRGTKVERNIVHLDDPIKPLDKAKEIANNLYNRKFIPTGTTPLPEKLRLKLEPVEETFGDSGFDVSLVDPANDQKHATLNLRRINTDKQYMMPSYIGVAEKLKGNKIQDILYQKGIETAQSLGYRGIRSGDLLQNPMNTLKAHERFNVETLVPNVEHKGIQHDIVGLLSHKNPNVIDDWFNSYQKLPKTKKVYSSPKEILNKFIKR